MSHTLRRAFTAVELLVILVVLVILAAVMIPILGTSRGNHSHGPRCISNLKQTGLAMLMYCGDYDDRYPTSEHSAPGADWASQIVPYTRNIDMFTCPLDKTRLPKPAEWPMGAARCPTHVYSYGLNSNLAGAVLVAWNGARLTKPPKSTTTLLSPANTVMFFEVSGAVGRIDKEPIDAESPTGNTTGNPFFANVPNSHPGQSYPDGINPDPRILHAYYATGNIGGRVLNGGEVSVGRHNGGSNYGFADGHVKFSKPEVVSGGADAVDPTCDQGTVAGQTGPCAKQLSAMAAGTKSTKYSVTFSTK